MKTNRLLRKRFAAATVSAILTVPLCQPAMGAEGDSWDVMYTSESRTLTLSGEMPYSDFVLMRIVPYRDRNTVLKDDAELTSEKDVVKTIEPQSDNVLSAYIQLPDEYVGERYIYHVNTEEECKSGYLICANVEKIKQKLPMINAADAAGMKNILNETSEQYGLDNGDSEKDVNYMAKLLVSFRPDGGYSAESFMVSYMQSEGVAYVKQKVYTMEQMLEAYEVYMDEDYSVIYSGMSDSEKKSLESQFQTELTGESFREMFAENKFLAEYRNADSTEKFKTIVLEYFKENNISLNDYNKISNEYKQNTVFDELYKKRQNQTTPVEIINEFNTAVQNVLKVTSSGGGSSTGGGPSSGGASSGSGSGLPFQRPNTNVTAITDSVQKKTFSDMDNHWSKEAVEAMAELNIINGFEDGSFKPDKKVTRAEFSKMIAVMLGLQEGNEHQFSDVDTNSWYAPYVSMTAEAGIVLGSNGEFMPDEDIMRQDAAVILYRALKNKDELADEQPEAGYKDAEYISDYAKDAVENLTKRGVLTGADGAFNPKNPMTRGEAATMLYRILDLI